MARLVDQAPAAPPAPEASGRDDRKARAQARQRLADQTRPLRVEIAQIDARLFERHGEMPAQIVVKSTQNFLAAIHQSYVSTEAVKNVRKFQRRVATANNNHALGKGLQPEGIVRRNAT